MVTESQRLFELLIVLLSAGNPQGAAHTPPPAPSLETKVLAVGEFREGEGCIAGFRRYGYHVTTKQCVAMAKAANMVVRWYQPDLTQPAVIIVPVKEGDTLAVIERVVNKKIVKEFILQKI